MNPQPGLLAGANQQENVCAHARQTAPSHLPRHAKGKGRAEGETVCEGEREGNHHLVQ